MSRAGRLYVVFVGLSLATFGYGRAKVQAAEVLINGDLESSASPLGWNLSTSVTGIPGSSIPALVEHNDGSNEPTVSPGQLGLLIKPQVGNQGIYAGMNKQTNITLEQTVTAPANRIYTLTGHAYFGGDANGATDDGYSGGVTTLDAMSPSGAVPSPTQTKYEVTFLNASNVELAPPTVLDLRTVQQNDATWHLNTLVTPTSPVGTTKARIRVMATDIVDNFGFQDMLWDNFSFRDNVVTTFERLTNANLNTPGDPLGWTQVEAPDVPGQGKPDTVNFVTPSINPNGNHTTGGQLGLWLKPFVNTTQFDPDIPTVDGALVQTVAGTPGATYDFSAWTVWENGYGGGFANSGALTFLRMEFLDGSAVPNVLGTQTLDLYAAGMRNDTDTELSQADWRQFSLNGVAPAGTISVRVSVGGQGMFNSSLNPQSLFFDDMSLNQTLPGGVQGDYNGNGVVDAADYVLWRNGGPLQNEVNTLGVVDASDYTAWRSRFGNTSGSGSLAGSAVPEPCTFSLLLLTLTGCCSARRRSR
jgi:hypothetical protein